MPPCLQHHTSSICAVPCRASMWGRRVGIQANCLRSGRRLPPQPPLQPPPQPQHTHPPERRPQTQAAPPPPPPLHRRPLSAGVGRRPGLADSSTLPEMLTGRSWASASAATPTWTGAGASGNAHETAAASHGDSGAGSPSPPPLSPPAVSLSARAHIALQPQPPARPPAGAAVDASSAVIATTTGTTIATTTTAAAAAATITTAGLPHAGETTPRQNIITAVVPPHSAVVVAALAPDTPVVAPAVTDSTSDALAVPADLPHPAAVTFRGAASMPLSATIPLRPPPSPPLNNSRASLRRRSPRAPAAPVHVAAASHRGSPSRDGGSDAPPGATVITHRRPASARARRPASAQAARRNDAVRRSGTSTRGSGGGGDSSDEGGMDNQNDLMVCGALRCRETSLPFALSLPATAMPRDGHAREQSWWSLTSHSPPGSPSPRARASEST